MIRRFFWYVLKAAFFVFAAVWIADRPGVIVIDWLGYRIESPVGIAILLSIVLIAFAALVYHLWRSFLALLERRQKRRQGAGHEALNKGMIAVALGDGAMARKLAERASRLLGESEALPLLLTAQAAQLNKDEVGAKTAYEMMLENRDMALLGFHGLIRLAEDRGDTPKALRLTREAGKLSPKARWVQERLFELSKAIGDHSAAEQALLAAQKSRILPKGEALRKRAILKREQALVLMENKRHREAVALMKEAFKLAPCVTAVAATYAESLILDHRDKEARKVLVKAWRYNPHRDLSAPYFGSFGALKPVSAVQEIKKLVASKPDSGESHFLLAEANLRARLWGSARHHLELLIQGEGQASRQACGLMARLEEGEHGGGKKATAWLSKAESAPPDKAWICCNCKFAPGGWTARCEQCQSFDSLEWRAPSRPTGEQQGQVGSPESPAQTKRGLPIPATETPSGDLPPVAFTRTVAVDRPDGNPEPSPKRQDSRETSLNPEATLRSLGQ